MASTTDDAQPIGTIWLMDLHGGRLARAPRLAAEFGQAGIESAAEVAAAMDLAGPAEVQRRLSSGTRCYVARVASKIVTYGWVSFEEEAVGELGLRIRLQPQEAYIWDCATKPAFRRNGLYTALLGHMAAVLRNESYRSVWIGADADNQPSLAGIAHAGFQHVADLVMAGLPAAGGPRLAWLEGRPEVPDSLVAEARRVFFDNRDRDWLPLPG